MKRILFLLPVMLFALSVSAEQFILLSPGGNLKTEIEVEENIRVVLFKENRIVLRLKEISLEDREAHLPGANFQVIKEERRTVKEAVKPEIREKARVLDNHFNELVLNLNGGLTISFRMYDEGLAYRFSTDLDDSLVIHRENLDVLFDRNDSVRFQASETFNSSYETPYQHLAVTGIKQGGLCHLPLLAEKENGLKVLVTEADLYHYPGLWLKGTGSERLTSTHPPYPEKLDYSGNVYGHGQIASTFNFIAKTKGKRTFPWRIFAVADDEKDLVANNMVYLLSSPNALDDVFWIKPGLVMFDWWAKNNIYGVDFEAGINTATAKYFIDFCAEQGFRYFLFDDGWSPKDDLLTVNPGLDMAEVTSYARSKGVDVMLWVIWHALEKQWDEAFDQFEAWGIKGIKMDFMNRDDQPMVEFYERVAQKAAEKGMVLNFHGAYKPSGLRRKYPNVLTREALIEFEYNGWTHHDDPVHHNLLPYIRMVTGPMDYIPATMRNATRENFRPAGNYPMGQGTRAHAMALFVILNSPMTMLPDSPSDYSRERECTEFLAKIPFEWDETVLLEGKLGDYTVLARRSGSDWYIGAITNWQELTLEVETDFLDKGNYTLEVIEDGLNANDRAIDFRRQEKTITAGQKLRIRMASGGGWIGRITPFE